MHIAIAGLGLIGGSFAKAIKAKTFHTVVGYDQAPAAIRQALACGAIDDTVTDDFSSADLILVALYPAGIVAFLKKYLHTFRPGATVVDLCGVKKVICDEAEALFQGSSVTFIGGHPMAGKESSGFVNAVETLFEGASMILTPFGHTPQDKLEDVEGFFRSMGFRQVVITTAEHHDEVIAYTSQLAHVVSSAYVRSPLAREFMGFSAGSFADMTRVAKLNEYMWTDLFLDNKSYLAGQIDTIIQNLTEFRDAIVQDDSAKLQTMLREGREIKERLG